MMINTITHYLRLCAERFPDKVAFRDSENSITFFELNRRARLLAGKINQRLGGAVKRPVGIYLPKGIHCIVAFMAAAYSGNYYTPLDISMPKARLEKILKVLSPAAVITDGANQAALPRCETILADDCKDEDLSNGLIEKIADSVIDTDVLYVMFTSGSTGDPKGVIISHRAVIDYIDWLADTFGFDRDTVFGNQAPFSFDNSVLDIYSTIKNGSETVIIPEEMFLSGGRLCNFVNENGINAIFWVPSAMALVANTGALERCPMKRLTKILFAGEVMQTRHLNIWRRFMPKAMYANLYGPTEIAVDCTYYIVNREFQDQESLPIGAACKNSGVMVLNEKNEPATVGEAGELCVRGSCLAFGYYRNPEKTKEAFVQNPLNNSYPEIIYRTGDLVKYNEQGELLYLGRKDFQIKHRGYRIELGEIETAASSAETVERCSAVYDNENRQIVLFVTPEDIDKKDLYAYLRSLLPGYMLPGLIVSEKAMPLNPNGKIDRLALADKLKQMS